MKMFSVDFYSQAGFEGQGYSLHEPRVGDFFELRGLPMRVTQTTWILNDLSDSLQDVKVFVEK